MYDFTMKIHHLNCGTLHPVSQYLVNGFGSIFKSATLVCNCLLVEDGDSWVLIDAGLGMADLQNPNRRLGKGFLRNTRPLLDYQECAIEQLKGLNVRPEDVSRVILTHVDIDHVGGISDFPWAEVTVSRTQHTLAMEALRLAVNKRLHPAQWEHNPLWDPRDLDEEWRGRPAASITENITLVSLPGHLEGHCGVVIELPGEQPLIHAGDAFMSLRPLNGKRNPLGLSLFESMMRTNSREWRESRTWLRARALEGCTVICAHEPLAL